MFIFFLIHFGCILNATNFFQVFLRLLNVLVLNVLMAVSVCVQL